MRRVLSLWLPAFAIERCGQGLWPSAARPDPRGRVGSPRERGPQALLLEDGPRILLDAVAEEMTVAGLAPGMPLADARALCPGLRAAPRDPAAEAAELARLADWAGRYTPWIAVDPWREAGGAAGLWLDVTGCAHLFGGEAALCEDLVRRLARRGFTARAGLAETPGAAWALARYGQASDAAPPVAWRIVAPGGLPAALVPLPVAGLRLLPAQVEVLARFGLTHIGDLLDLPAAALAPRIGPAVTARLEQALGARAESLTPRRPRPPHLLRRSFGEAIAAPEDIARAIEGLIAGLCEGLAAASVGARGLEVVLYRVDGSHDRLTLGVSRATRDPAHLKRLFAERLERIDPGFGIDVLTLAATRVEPLTALQLSLKQATPQQLGPRQSTSSCTAAAPGPAAPSPATTSPATAGDLAALVDRLTARLGAGAVARQARRASYLPEASVMPAAPLGRLPEVKAPPLPPRPLRLLVWPEPLQVTAPLPDHPPLQFRWRRVLHRVVRAEGPERIAAEWWNPDDKAAAGTPRDYFRVEDEDGRRFWLYRSADGWFLQGLFA